MPAKRIASTNTVQIPLYYVPASFSLCHQILSFWVPMAMVAMNFGPLRSVLLSALRLSRGSEESGVAY